MTWRGHDRQVQTADPQPVSIAKAVVPHANGSNRSSGELAKTPA
jgi:hypothetical protein